MRGQLQRRGADARRDAELRVDVVHNVTTALGIAAHGLAARSAPAYVSALAAPLGLMMRRVVEPEIVRKVCLYRPLARTLSPAAEGFTEHLMACLARRWNAKRKTSR